LDIPIARGANLFKQADKHVPIVQLALRLILCTEYNDGRVLQVLKGKSLVVQEIRILGEQDTFATPRLLKMKCVVARR